MRDVSPHSQSTVKSFLLISPRPCRKQDLLRGVRSADVGPTPPVSGNASLLAITASLIPPAAPQIYSQISVSMTL